MTKNSHKLILAIITTFMFAACSPYNAIVKSTDKEAIYQAGFAAFSEGKYSHSLKLFNAATPYFLGTQREDTVAFYIGISSYKMGDFTSSAHAFDDFRRRYPRSPFLEDASYMYAKGFYYNSPDVQKDQTWTEIAIYNINDYLDHYPNSVKKQALLENIDELQGKLYLKSYLNAYTYYKILRYKAAIAAFRQALSDYPQTPYREQILYHIAKSGYLLAKDSYPELQRDRYLSVLDYYYNFVGEFPESQHLKELNKIEADTRAFLDKYDKKEEIK